MNSAVSEKRGFLVLLGCMILLGVFVLWPFLKTIVLSMVFAVLFFPLHKRILRLCKGKKALSAFLSIVLVFFLLIIPVLLLVMLVTVQVQKLLTQAPSDIISGLFVSVQIWVTKLEDMMNVQFHFLDFVKESLQTVGNYLAQYSPNMVMETANFFFHFFIMMMILFYFFMDGERFLEIIIRLTPVKDKYERHLATEMKTTIYGVFYSSFFSALLQAVAASLGYYIAGIEAYLVWGCVTFFVAFIPVVGTALVLAPLIISLFLQGNTGHAIFLSLYSILIIGSIDNIIKPLLIKGDMHPLVLFLSVFGGMTMFGPIGLLLGPIIMSMLTATIKIYSRDFTGVSIENVQPKA